MDPWSGLHRDIVGCTRCPRLRAHCEQVARVKRRAFLHEDYWGKPVPGFGDHRARVLLVGLAPAAHGANRTGRMFTGDDSGNWLYAALYAAGFASQPTSTGEEDGLTLRNAFITASARCAPPDNKPSPEEMERCAPYFDREVELLDDVRVVVALGGIAWGTILKRAARVDPASVPRPRPVFAHGAEAALVLRKDAAPVALVGSYHPSRQNTNTGRLTRPMLDAIFVRVRELL